MRACAVALTALLLAGVPAAGARAATDGVAGGSATEAGAGHPAPFAIGGPFTLTDHRGQRVSDTDFRGRFLLLFFGYAACRNLCPVALERLVAAYRGLPPALAARVQPLFVTVDPARDDPATLARRVGELDADLVGLTGSPAEIAAVLAAYRVSAEARGRAWDGEPIISHGGFIYLMGPDGALRSLLPPVLSAQQVSEIVAGYVAAEG